MSDFDGVVIGAGQNGLVAANLLADRGWKILVLEEQADPGGAVRSAEVTRPGFVTDLYSAFYPLTAVSPIYRKLELERHGLRWRRAPNVLAHPARDGRCAYLSNDLDETAAALAAFAPGDGDAWRRLYAYWERIGPSFVEALLSPMPPIRGGSKLLRAIGPSEIARFLRFSLLPVRRLAEERFAGEGGGWMLAASALHADLTPESGGGGFYGWLLCGVGQQVGWPVPEGGAGEITAALVRRLETLGGEVRCSSRVERVLIRRGRAVGVRTAAREEISAPAVLADVGAPALFNDLVGAEHLPGGFLRDLDHFQYDNATVKVDWALDGPIPWSAEPARRAGTVHVAEGMDGLTRASTQIVRKLIPDRPFLVVGQYAAADPTRMPAGKESAWAYTHVPQAVVGDAGGGLTGSWDARETEEFTSRMEAEIERLAPGFKDLILARHVATPRTLQEHNANLVGGAINSGTAQIHQQLIFRPVPGLGRAETPIAGLFLAGASAHPGGGVHGGPGSNAARAAIARRYRRRAIFAVGAGVGVAAGARSQALR